jgi:hypothetical protein
MLWGNDANIGLKKSLIRLFFYGPEETFWKKVFIFFPIFIRSFL